MDPIFIGFIVLFIIFCCAFPFILLWFLAKRKGMTMMDYAKKYGNNHGRGSRGIDSGSGE